MAVSEIHFLHSTALGKMTSATVIFPEGHSGPFPVFYLLHGLSDDHTTWARRTSIERYVEGLPFIVVMPNGERGFYVDAKARPCAAYETYLMKELAGFVDATFRTIPGRQGRVIAGLSMGGYGALSLALKHPDAFAAAASHSGALEFGTRPVGREEPWRREFIPLIGSRPRGGRNDLFALAAKADRARLPALRIDCGRRDFLLGANRAFRRHLVRLGIAHEYAEHPGAHDWAYWDRHIQDTIRFFVRRLGLSGRG